MPEIRETEHYRKWFDRLRDERARARIDARVLRLALGIFGDIKSVGGRVNEARIDYGPGYRLYFTRKGNSVVILLCGGDKSSQPEDIAKAKSLAETL